jgi:AcrR family transcriptional regulator
MNDLETDIGAPFAGESLTDGQDGVETRASDLLARAVAYLHRAGLAGFSLANLGEQLGVSSRMLIYHLGQKDEILAQVVEAMRREITTELGGRHYPRLSDAVQATWDFYVARVPDMEVFFHLVSRSFENPESFVEFTSTAVSAWTDVFREAALQEGYSKARADAMAHVGLAGFRGLILDLAITGNLKRTSLAMTEFTSMLDMHSGRPDVT